MPENRRLARLTRALVASIVIVGVSATMPSVVLALELTTGGPETTQPDTTEPDTTEPDTTQPDTTEPDTTEPGQGTDDDSANDALVVVTIIGFGALVALAGWWMVQRRDEDDAPHPRPPTDGGPLPGQDLV